MSHLPIQHKNETTPGCQSTASSLKLYAQAKLRSIDSVQNRTCADHYQKTNNVGSGQLRYTIWHFVPPPLPSPPTIQPGLKCLINTRSRQSVNSNICHSNEG